MADYRLRHIKTRSGIQLLVCDHCYAVIEKEEGRPSPDVLYDFGVQSESSGGCEVHEPSYPINAKWATGEVSFHGTWNRALCEHGDHPHPPHATYFLPNSGDPVFCPGTPGPGMHIHYHWAIKGDIRTASEFYASWGRTCEEAGYRETDYPRELSGPLPTGTGHACGKTYNGDYRPV